MKFLEGVGDSMSMFNNADPQQRFMMTNPTYCKIEDQFYRMFDASI